MNRDPWLEMCCIKYRDIRPEKSTDQTSDILRFIPYYRYGQKNFDINQPLVNNFIHLEFMWSNIRLL